MKYSRFTSYVITSLIFLVSMETWSGDKVTKSMDYTGKLTVSRAINCGLEVKAVNTNSLHVYSVKKYHETLDGIADRNLTTPMELDVAYTGGNDSCLQTTVRAINSMVQDKAISERYMLVPLSTSGLTGTGPAYARIMPYVADIIVKTKKGDFHRGFTFKNGTDAGVTKALKYDKVSVGGTALSSSYPKDDVWTVGPAQVTESGSVLPGIVNDGSLTQAYTRGVEVSGVTSPELLLGATFKYDLGVSKKLYDAKNVELKDYSVVTPGLKLIKTFTVTINPI